MIQNVYRTLLNDTPKNILGKLSPHLAHRTKTLTYNLYNCQKKCPSQEVAIYVDQGSLYVKVMLAYVSVGDPKAGIPHTLKAWRWSVL